MFGNYRLMLYKIRARESNNLKPIEDIFFKNYCKQKKLVISWLVNEKNFKEKANNQKRRITVKIKNLKERGITLVALIVTIIILLILAGVTIGLATGQSDIIQRAKNTTKEYSKSSDEEYLQQLGYSYAIDKIDNENLKLENVLAEQDRIDEVKNNGDGTLNVEIDDYEYTIKEDGTEITKVEKLKGTLPQISYGTYSDMAGTSTIDTSKKYDNIYIGVKIANASEYTKGLTLELTDPKGKKINTTTVNGFDGYYTTTSNGTYTLKVTGINSEGIKRTQKQKIEINNLDILTGSTIFRAKAPKVSITGLQYADLDKDGVADGIIVADISKDSSDTKNTYKGGNPWGTNGYGSFSYTKQTTGLKEYKEEPYTYTGGGSSASGTLVMCTNDSGNPRYYVLALADYDNIRHCWYSSANGILDTYHDPSYNDFGKGKEFTKYNIEKWNSSAYGNQNANMGYIDILGIIQDEVKEGWFVPSRAEWAAFASYLNISKTSTDSNYYANYGLSAWNWTSSQATRYRIYVASGSEIGANDANYVGTFRLATTF